MKCRDYILQGHLPVLEQDLIAWAIWFENADRTVCKIRKRGVEVSTVFLAIDYNFEEGDPLLFETMVFGGKYDGLQRRCSTWEQAASQHLDVCHKIFGKHF